MFTHLHVHSYYSLLYGTMRVEEIARTAKAYGYEAIALTDINNLYGVHAFIEACGREGIRPIIGAELRTEHERAVVLAKTREGFSNLNRLITLRMNDPSFDLALSLKTHAPGLAILSDNDALIAALHGEPIDLSAMITPHSRRAATTAARLHLPLVAVGEATFLSQDDLAVHRVLSAIARQTTIGDVDEDACAPPGSFLRSPADMNRIFTGFEEAVARTHLIADVCRFDHIFDGWIFPEYPGVDRGRVSSLLRERVIAGAEQRYGEISEGVLDRIDYELGIITAKGFAPYFLVVADIVSEASRTCGRGSAAASIVSYCLGITNVDPIRHNLYFERFLNPDRVDPPDIDVDFAWDERDAVIESVMKRYGEECSAMVSTHIHFQRRSALREVARVYGMPEKEISAFEKAFSVMARRGEKIERDAVWSEIAAIAARITGFPRHLSVHVGGVVITPNALSGYAPIEKAPKGVRIVTWDKDGVEEAGLVKIDLLGNRSLAVVRDALANVSENGTVIDPYQWNPLDDPDTIQLLARGDSMGVFYVESPAMRQLQRKTARGDFEHLVIHSSIIRPAANKYIAEYVDRLKGKPYEPLHPRLDTILRETYGIMCYQEDVSKVAIALADFTPAEADTLRKILSKKGKEQTLARYREQFFEGARRNGVDEGIIARIWEMICSFDGYSFCKPHSASYAMVSFQSAYLKAHHPAEFIAAVLSNGGGYYTASAYISEARRMGLTVLPPDINESRYRYTGKGKTVRVGFMAIKALRYDTVRSILESKQASGSFISIEDLMARCDITPADAQALVSVGALDSISGKRDRYEQLWVIFRHLNTPAIAEEMNLSLPFKDAGAVKTKRKVQPALERLVQEYTYLGFLCQTHILVLWDKRLATLPRIKARDIPKHMGEVVTVAGLLVTRKQVLTRGDEIMEFISFEDDTAIFEAVLFPDTYMKYLDILDETTPFLIRGKVENDRESVCGDD
jgi:DNA polymerase-3 subunit alpha/error-prone DNA polymerase